jgi:(2Fe-2S) ferredoxin
VLTDLTDVDCLNSCLWECAASRFTSKSGIWLQQIYTKLLEEILSKHKDLKIKLIMPTNDSLTFPNHSNVEGNIPSSKKLKKEYQDTS